MATCPVACLHSADSHQLFLRSQRSQDISGDPDSTLSRRAVPFFWNFSLEMQECLPLKSESHLSECRGECGAVGREVEEWIHENGRSRVDSPGGQGSICPCLISPIEHCHHCHCLPSRCADRIGRKRVGGAGGAWGRL